MHCRYAASVSPTTPNEPRQGKSNGVTMQHDFSTLTRNQGGLDYVAREANCEAKASEQGRTDGGYRRGVFGDGGQRVRTHGADGERAIAKHRTESRNYSR